MSRLNKSFAAGCGLGCAAALIGPALLVLAMAFVMPKIPVLNDLVLGSAAARLAPPPLPPGTLADYDWSVTGPDGETLPIARFEGRVLMLHFWQPGCVNCLAELPGIMALYHDITARGLDLAFVSVAIGAEEKAAAAMADYDPPFTVYTYPESPPPPFDLKDTPGMFIVDRDGGILVRRIGAARWDDPSVLAYLERIALAPTEPAP